MNAIVYRAGIVEKVQLEHVEMPQPKVGEALIRLQAAALNHRDEWMRQGKYPNLTDGTILGSDGCGTVEAVGSTEDAHWIGRSVVINPNINWGHNERAQAADYHILGMPTNGTLAQYIAVPIHRLAHQPDHLDAFQAAALPLAGLTAWRALFYHGQLQAGQRVMITGAGGGVSQIAILFALAKGAIVSITSGDEAKLQQWKQSGVHHAYNYKHQDWVKQAEKNEPGYDLVVDSTGGNQINSLIRLTAAGGKIVFYGATTGVPEKIDLHRMFWKQISLQGSTMGSDSEFEQMIQFVSKHKITPLVDSVRPLSNALAAFDKMRQANQLGKLVIDCK
jgi:zinc-binding alcohol dehydrogenase/oxidoreductase